MTDIILLHINLHPCGCPSKFSRHNVKVIVLDFDISFYFIYLSDNVENLCTKHLCCVDVLCLIFYNKQNRCMVLILKQCFILTVLFTYFKRANCFW